MGAISCAYLVPATQTPWGPLTPNNPLTSHLDGEERVGAVMAMVTANGQHNDAGVEMARAGVMRARPNSQHDDAGMAMVTADMARATAEATTATTMAMAEHMTHGSSSCFEVWGG